MADSRGREIVDRVRQAVADTWECDVATVADVVVVATTPEGAIGIMSSTIGVHPTLHVLELGIASLLERGDAEGQAIK